MADNIRHYQKVEHKSYKEKRMIVTSSIGGVAGSMRMRGMTVNYCALLMSVALVQVVMHPEAWKNLEKIRYDSYPQLYINAVMSVMDKVNDRLLKTTKMNEK